MSGATDLRSNSRSSIAVGVLVRSLYVAVQTPFMYEHIRPRDAGSPKCETLNFAGVRPHVQSPPPYNLLLSLNREMCGRR